MDFTLSTPALLFPAISLLLLAYTNRFLTLASLIRELHARYKANRDGLILGQIANLRYRIVLIRNMQAFGIASLLLCVISMFCLFMDWVEIGKWVFCIGLILMAISLFISFREILVSIDALEIRLKDLEE